MEMRLSSEETWNASSRPNVSSLNRPTAIHALPSNSRVTDSLLARLCSSSMCLAVMLKKVHLAGLILMATVPFLFLLRGRRTLIKLLNGDVDQDNSYDADCVDCGKQGSEGFCILDADATDGSAEICVLDPFASDQPCTDLTTTCDEPATYAIFARTVGKGSAKAGLCVDIDGTESCYVGSTEINLKKATDISQQLLTVCVGDVKIGLFDALCKNDAGDLGACGTGDFTTETTESYYWEYTNDGNRRAEFRFYDATLLNEMTDSDCFGVTRGNAEC